MTNEKEEALRFFSKIGQMTDMMQKMGMKNPSPWSGEKGNEQNPFPKFGNGNQKLSIIGNGWEQEFQLTPVRTRINFKFEILSSVG